MLSTIPNQLLEQSVEVPLPRQETRPIRLLIDTDPGIDDMMAILLALTNKDTEIRAITLTHGNTSLVNVTRNICTLFHNIELNAKATGADIFANDQPVRVAIGSECPLKGGITFDAEDFHGRDGFGNLTKSRPHLIDPHWEKRLCSSEESVRSLRFKPSELSAVDEILHQIKSCPPFTLTILAVGPLTNIAKAIQKDPVTMGLVKRFVVMGGAINAPGNISPLAEFNFYADPHSAAVVFDATKGFVPDAPRIHDPNLNQIFPLHVTLVPLDITHTTFLMREYAELKLRDRVDSQPLADMFLNMLASGFKFTLDFDKVDGIALHDPLAAGIALGLVQPESTSWMTIHVETMSPLTWGACVVDKRHNPPLPIKPDESCIEVCFSIANPKSYQEFLLDAVFPC